MIASSKEKQFVTKNNLDRAMKSVADEFAQLRPELKERFEVLERRTERIYINLNSVLMQVAGMSKSLSDARAPR